MTIELTANGVQEVSARIRTAADQAEAAKLMQKIAPALERFDRAVRKQSCTINDGHDGHS